VQFLFVKIHMSNSQFNNVRTSYPVFLEIARRRQMIRRVLHNLPAQQVLTLKTSAL
jgi:hypothetical protein